MGRTDGHQQGLIGANYGRSWIIEDCLVTDSRCVGVGMGFVPGQDYRHIETMGHHVIRNNTIRRCGQGGITGSYCLVASLIEGNLIEDIGSLGEFNGHELAFVKIHYAVDTVIKNNVVRNSARDGIWLDTRAQGARITGNVIYDVSEWGIFPEVNHGPILVDNNIVYGGVNYEDSEAVSYVHNLFIDSYMDFQPVDKRQLVYFKPHTLNRPAGGERSTATTATTTTCSSASV